VPHPSYDIGDSSYDIGDSRYDIDDSSYDIGDSSYDIGDSSWLKVSAVYAVALKYTRMPVNLPTHFI